MEDSTYDIEPEVPDQVELSDPVLARLIDEYGQQDAVLKSPFQATGALAGGTQPRQVSVGGRQSQRQIRRKCSRDARQGP